MIKIHFPYNFSVFPNKYMDSVVHKEPVTRKRARQNSLPYIFAVLGC